MVELRDAQFADYAAIAQLHAKSWQTHYRGLMNNAFLENEVEQERLDAWHERLKFPPANQDVIVATFNNDIMGFACLCFDDDPVHGSLLDNLHVSAGLQKSGIGKMLLKECARRIIEKSSDRKMYLWVFEMNGDARAVYDHLGGRHAETVEKQNFDGGTAKVCRYVWADVSVLL